MMKSIRYWTNFPFKNPQRWMRNLGLDSKEFELVYDAKDPEYLIATELIYTDALAHSNFRRLYSPGRVAIYYADEAIVPDMNVFDYAMSYDKRLVLDDRIIRRPVLSVFGGFTNRRFDVGCENPEAELMGKSGFCNFIYSNPNAHPRRDWMFHTLSDYKRVDSLGPHLNNCGNRTSRGSRNFAELAVEMKTPYKFSISCENACYHGYISEKILTSFAAHSIPIYWGDPDCESEFNPKAFINANGLTAAELIDRVREIDEHDDKWMAMISEPPMLKSQMEQFERDDAQYRAFMRNVFLQDVQDAKRAPQGYWPDNYRRHFFKSRVERISTQNKILAMLGRETRLAEWVIRKIRPLE